MTCPPPAWMTVGYAKWPSGSGSGLSLCSQLAPSSDDTAMSN
eukprot:CAMPEP_0177790516 /NCGR_PEP_ID=MMETSP0491_2-20121128/23402_1 /TAXON_ID=63592 /ORGANISM="Tetraselmis chuii, Strain PLY429" /LENGTH=41 /DNA_ID= /DNA_START= /DNA_END= /DNA_ORIENTATION=